MTTKLEDFFDLAEMEKPDNTPETVETPEVPATVLADAEYAMKLREIEARILHDEDHSKSMDELFSESIRHSRDMMDLAYSTDPRSQRGMFEVATAMYRNALDAKNSKRGVQIDLLKHIVAEQKLELEKAKLKGANPQALESTSEDNTPKGVPLDRNAILNGTD